MSSEIDKNLLPTQLSIFTWRYWRIKSRFQLFWPRSKPRADHCWPNVTLKRRFCQHKNDISCRERRMAVRRNLCCNTSTTWLLRRLCWCTSKGRLQSTKRLCQKRFLQALKTENQLNRVLKVWENLQIDYFSGTAIHILKMLAGHRSISTTAAYLYSSPSQLKAAVELVWRSIKK